MDDDARMTRDEHQGATTCRCHVSRTWYKKTGRMRRACGEQRGGAGEKEGWWVKAHSWNEGVRLDLATAATAATATAAASTAATIVVPAVSASSTTSIITVVHGCRLCLQFPRSAGRGWTGAVTEVFVLSLPRTTVWCTSVAPSRGWQGRGLNAPVVEDYCRGEVM